MSCRNPDCSTWSFSMTDSLLALELPAEAGSRLSAAIVSKLAVVTAAVYVTDHISQGLSCWAVIRLQHVVSTVDGTGRGAAQRP